MEKEISINKEIRIASGNIVVSAMIEGNTNNVSTVTISTKWDFLEMDIRNIPTLLMLLESFLNKIPSDTRVHAVV